MDRRLAGSTDLIRFRVDATRCDGQGVCVLVAPELFELDRYGLAYVVAGADELTAADADVREQGLEADAMCPRNAIFEQLAFARPAPAVVEDLAAEPAVVAPRLVLPAGEREDLPGWRGRGGWVDRSPADLLALVRAAGLVGHGGAGFPTASKWDRILGADQPVVVVNGAEREPGTGKDRYLLTSRPSMVLDGARLALRAIGGTLGIVAIDDESEAAVLAFEDAVAEATAAGLLDGLELRLQRVPTRYVAGEETALLSVIEGGKPLPRLRPPFPSDVGVFGRPTLVQNVETIAQLALAAAIGAEAYRSAGLPDAPGTGVFSVSAFGAPVTVLEREFGHSLRDLVSEQGLLDGARGALVGGYAGGLLAPDGFDVPLTADALRRVGASLGTKSVQVLTAAHCPVRVAADIVGYFGEQTAEQCPPCSRGLPDMAAILRTLEDGTPDPAALKELETFMATLAGRGVCRLPDGAARIVLTLFEHFAEDVAAHAADGCPLRTTP